MNCYTPNQTEKKTQYRNYQGGYFTTLIAPEQTNETLAVVDMTLPKGAEPPVHIHTLEDETFYLLQGDITFHIGDEITEAKEGDAVFAPRLVPHYFAINSPSARFLTVITPGRMLEYFIEFSTPAGKEPVIVPPQGPPPAAAIEHMTKRLTETYGVVFI